MVSLPAFLNHLAQVSLVGLGSQRPGSEPCTSLQIVSLYPPFLPGPQFFHMYIMYSLLLRNLRIGWRERVRKPCMPLTRKGGLGEVLEFERVVFLLGASC